MNPNDLASLLSSVGSGGASGLMQGSHRGRLLAGTSTRHVTFLLDAFTQQTPDSRPNTAPAGTRSTGSITATTTGGTTSASSSRPIGSSSSSKHRNDGTGPLSSTTAPRSGSGLGTTSGSKVGPIQMSALTNILANLSDKNAAQGNDRASAAKPAIDLYDIMTSEVNLKGNLNIEVNLIIFVRV